MTVKELRDILNQCEDDAEVVISAFSERLGMKMEQPFTCSCSKEFGELVMTLKGDE